MRGRRGRGAWIAVAVLLIACALVVWGHAKLAFLDEDTGTAEVAATEEVADAVSRIEDAQVSFSSAEAFLSDLARVADATHGVTWEDEGDIPGCAALVLASYRDQGECELACSGYLDIKGNAWGAVVWCPPDWVDVVYITVPDGGSASTVRIVRLSPDDGI